jgi:hypothetical protein
MSSFLSQDLLQRVNRLRDDLSRNTSQLELQVRRLESDNVELRNRVRVLTRILIAKQIATAEEIAMALTDGSRPVVPPGEGPADTESEHPSSEAVS